MAQEEGFRRLKMIARIVVLIGLSFIVAASATGLLSIFLEGSLSGFSYIELFIGLYLSLTGGFLRLVLWIVEGFLFGPNAPQR